MYQHVEEELGLSRVGMLGWGGGYEWDVVIVWKHDDGSLWYGAASGCSCNSPEDTFCAMGDLQGLNWKTWDAFAEAVKNCYDADPADKTSFLSKISALLR